MKRKAQYIYAGHGGKPVYVDGFLTNERAGAETPAWTFEVTASGPEPGPKPGTYSPKDLPGGWMQLLPDQERNWSEEDDRLVMQSAKEAGFSLMD
jgi:hypothetical protein